MDSYNGTIRQYTPATVMCYNCSRPIDGTTGLTMCMECIRSTSKLTVDIPRESTAQFCRNCERFLVPPSTWVVAQPESRELLALLLKKLPGLMSKSTNIRLVDAGFLWTEPHSKRIKINVTVQGEAQSGSGVILQETFPVEYVVINTQCADCARSFTVHQWRASLQLRQKVPHKRTFLYLEQLMLRHNAHVDCVSISESRDGIDFFFSKPNHAIKLLEFLANVAPIRSGRSEQLISTDTHTGSSQYKFSYSVEIAPICRDDLVILPADLAAKMGNISRVVLCSKITSAIQFLDPNTLQIADLPGNVYWREPFQSLETSNHLHEFVVLDVELLGPMRGRNVLCDVMIARSSDMGQSYIVRSHLGAFIHPGDTVLGYFLVNTNFNSDAWESLPAGAHPDVVLVKKSYPKKNKRRVFKLKRMAKERDEGLIDNGRDENDYDAFLEELEEDPELRQTINLYKDHEALQQKQIMQEQGEDDGPEIDVTELLDDLEI